MREIKFRAWDKSSEDMRYEVEMDLSPMLLFPSLWELMQYTGLKDKNGKEIYEGDILAVDNEWQEPDGSAHWVDHKEHYSVIWGAWNGGDNETETWILSGPKHAARWNDLYPGDLYEHAENSEVIGNIYENPELLNKK